MSKTYQQESTDRNIEDWAQNIVLAERGIMLSDAEVFSLLNDSGLIHLARMWGEGDTEVGDQILEAFDHSRSETNKCQV